MIEIPTEFAGESHVELRIALTGRDYVLTFDWNQRDGHWFLSIATPDGTPIISGVKLVANHRLLQGRLEALRPPGEIMVLDLLEPAIDPGFADLGVRHTLNYFESSELA